MLADPRADTEKSANPGACHHQASGETVPAGRRSMTAPPVRESAALKLTASYDTYIEYCVHLIH